MLANFTRQSLLGDMWKTLFPLLTFSFAFLSSGEAARILSQVDSPPRSNGNRLLGASANGQFVLFASEDETLKGSSGIGFHYFVIDTDTGSIEQIDVDSSENPDDVSFITVGAISDNGQFVVFASEADGLVAGDTNGEQDLFLRDRQAGETYRISVDAGGNEVTVNVDPTAPGDSVSFIDCDVSDDGTKIVFVSGADQFFPSGECNFYGAFLQEVVLDPANDALTSNTLSLISLGPTATDEPNGDCGSVAIAADGSIIAFDSRASNLIASDLNGVGDVFVRDIANGLQRISVNGGSEGNGVSLNVSITSDGSKVGFDSRATNLFPADSDPRASFYTFEFSGGTLATPLLDGSPLSGNTTGIISTDGDFALLLNDEIQIPHDTRDGLIFGEPYAYVFDFTGGQPFGRISTQPNQNEIFAGVDFPGAIVDGGTTFIATAAPNITPGDTNGVTDVFLFQAGEAVQENTFAKNRSITARRIAQYKKRIKKAKSQLRVAKRKKQRAKVKRLKRQIRRFQREIRALR